MKENDARGKLCPIRRPTKTTNCIGSCCMAWRTLPKPQTRSAIKKMHFIKACEILGQPLSLISPSGSIIPPTHKAKITSIMEKALVNPAIIEELTGSVFEGFTASPPDYDEDTGFLYSRWTSIPREESAGYCQLIEKDGGHE